MIVELDHLSVIEVVYAHGREDREPRIRGRGSLGLEAGAIKDYAGSTLAKLRESRGYTRASGKSREINAPAINRQTLLRIFKHGLCRFSFDFPGAVTGIVRTRHDVAVAFGAVFHQLDRTAAICAGIEGVNYGREPGGRIRLGNIERVTLLGICNGHHFRNKRPRREVLWEFTCCGRLLPGEGRRKNESNGEKEEQFAHASTIDAPTETWESPRLARAICSEESFVSPDGTR